MTTEEAEKTVRMHAKMAGITIEIYRHWIKFTAPEGKQFRLFRSVGCRSRDVHAASWEQAILTLQNKSPRE